jgi:hypothetical protein
MMSMLVRRRQSALYLSAALVVLGEFSAGCMGYTRLPPGCEANAPPSTPAALKACVEGLEFSTLEAAGDEQVLTIVENGQGSSCPGSVDKGRSCRYGPLATIQPEVTSYELKYPALHEGRIIARLFVPAGEKAKYDSLALAPGATTYWWVQVTKSKREYESADSGYVAYPTNKQPDGVQHYDKQQKKEVYGRSVFVSEQEGKLVMKERPLYYRKHVGKFKQALARWVWDPDDETAQGSCGSGCCR